MFGYVNANKSTLVESDQKIYQNYYCGLCQDLKRVSGPRGQLLLNYDVTFLALLLSGLYEPKEDVKSFTCRLHPTQKKTIVKSQIMDYCSYMDIALSYYNLLDDYQDDGKRGKKRMADYFEKFVLEAEKKYPRQVAAIRSYIEKQNLAEKSQEKNLDKVASYTGEMLGELCKFYDEDVWNDDLYTLGYYLGRFIYVMDAYEDMEKDQKKCDYNILSFHSEECPNCYETFVRQFLTTQMTECAKAFEHMPILKNAEVIRNIIYSGVWTKYDYIQVKSERRKEK